MEHEKEDIKEGGGTVRGTSVDVVSDAGREDDTEASRGAGVEATEVGQATTTTGEGSGADGMDRDEVFPSSVGGMSRARSLEAVTARRPLQ